jgi:hypothetical protein
MPADADKQFDFSSESVWAESFFLQAIIFQHFSLL